MIKLSSSLDVGLITLAIALELPSPHGLTTLDIAFDPPVDPLDRAGPYWITERSSILNAIRRVHRGVEDERTQDLRYCFGGSAQACDSVEPTAKRGSPLLLFIFP